MECVYTLRNRDIVTPISFAVTRLSRSLALSRAITDNHARVVKRWRRNVCCDIIAARPGYVISNKARDTPLRYCYGGTYMTQRCTIGAERTLVPGTVR